MTKEEHGLLVAIDPDFVERDSPLTPDERASLLAIGRSFEKEAHRHGMPMAARERSIVAAYFDLKAAYEAEIDPLNPQTPE